MLPVVCCRRRRPAAAAAPPPCPLGPSMALAPVCGRWRVRMPTMNAGGKPKNKPLRPRRACSISWGPDSIASRLVFEPEHVAAAALLGENAGCHGSRMLSICPTDCSAPHGGADWNLWEKGGWDGTRGTSLEAVTTCILCLTAARGNSSFVQGPLTRISSHPVCLQRCTALMTAAPRCH